MSKLYTIAVLFAIIVIAGCAKAPTGAVTFVCEKPYIQVGSDCCLDRDANNICDKDESEDTVVENVSPTESLDVSQQNKSEVSPPKLTLDTRTDEEKEKFGNWCVKSDYNELVDPIIEIDRLYLLGANHYYLDKDSWLIDKVLDGSNYLVATGFLMPFSEYAYQSYNIANLTIEGRLHGQNRDYIIPDKYSAINPIKTQSYDTWQKSDDIYLLWLLSKLEVNDTLQYKLEYGIGKKHIVVCHERNLTVIDQKPRIDVHLVEKTSFTGGPYIYRAEYTLGSSTSTNTNNIFTKDYPDYGKIKPYASIAYKNDTISILTNLYSYPLSVRWPDDIECTDPANCKIKLEFNRDKCGDMMQNLCKQDSYLIVGVYNPETEEGTEVIIKPDRNTDFAEICSQPCS